MNLYPLQLEQYNVIQVVFQEYVVEKRKHVVVLNGNMLNDRIALLDLDTFEEIYFDKEKEN